MGKERPSDQLMPEEFRRRIAGAYAGDLVRLRETSFTEKDFPFRGEVFEGRDRQEGLHQLVYITPDGKEIYGNLGSVKSHALEGLKYFAETHAPEYQIS